MGLAAWANGAALGAAELQGGRRTLVEWSDRLAVGVREIDEQHKRLVDLINDFSDAMYSGNGKHVLGAALMALEEYASHHFHTEERLMERHGYAESAEHKHGHALFSATIRRLRHRFDSGHAEIAVEVLFFLREWLVTHILKADRELGRAVSRSGVA